MRDWTDCCEGLEKQILRLEVQNHDPELIDDLLERIHRIKRGSSFSGWTVARRMSHEMETALQAVRKREIEVDAELIDHLLSVAEALNEALRQTLKRLGEPVRGQEGEAFEFPVLDDEPKWRDATYRLYLHLENKRSTPAIGEGEKAKIAPEDAPVKTKEQFLFDMYGHLDRMTHEWLVRLERDANDREALGELLSTVRGMKQNTEAFRSALSPESAHDALLDDLLNVVSPYEQLLVLIRDKKPAFLPDDVSLGRETAGYIQAVLEAMALDHGEAKPYADLLDRIRHAIAVLASLSESMPESQKTALTANPDHPAETAPKAVLPPSIRVSQDKLDKMMNMISELLIAKNAFMHLSTKLNAEYDLPELSREVKEVGVSVNRISDELQNAIMSIRMVEIKTVFQRMPRIVRDVAQLTGKKMELVMAGETTEIDKTIVEQISDPLVHLIRNAADHGIESREERLRKGKSETGRIALRAYNKDKHVYIEVEDDGKGIDPETVKRKALERGFITPEQAERMTRNQLIHLIFLPGFSTAGQITEVSGRGVGMDVVKSNIEKINGTIFIESERDKGTKVVIRLPLTLAISRGLVVDVLQETYIVPIEYISKTVKISRNDIHAVNGKYFAALDGEVIGIEWMSKLFLLGDRNLDRQEEFHAVIISNGQEKFGLIVDKLRNEQEFVIKTFSGQLAATPGISGSTLLGNGRVVLIVNPLDLIQLAKNE